MEQRFRARLVGTGPTGSWAQMILPFKVEEVFGKKAQVKVAGTVNGVAFRSSVIPVGDGTHYFHLNKDLAAAAKTGVGEIVDVVMRLDTAERTVEVPVELQRALDENAEAAGRFTSLAYSHQKEYAVWIAGAKRDETKAARVEKAVAMLVEGRRLS